MMVGTAAQEAGVGVSMASHHAAVLMETRASLTSAHDAGTAPHCHKAAKAAPDGAADAGKAPLPRWAPTPRRLQPLRPLRTQWRPARDR